MSDTQQPMPAFWAAFLTAQKAMRDPAKDTQNPHFRSKFVSLKGVADAVRPALHSAGIVVTQLIDADETGPIVRTILAHTSGGLIQSHCPVLTAKPNDAQAMGSAVTYARRYALAAICGVCPSDDDDDGEGSVSRAPVKAKARPQVKARASAPPAQSFADVGAALAALGSCTTAEQLKPWGRRVASSQFADADLAILRRSAAERRAQLSV